MGGKCIGIIGWILAFVLHGCIVERETTPLTEEYIQVGDRLPYFSLQMSDGTQLTTSDLEGKVSFIMFFTTKCSDCQKELPIVQRVYDSYRKDSTVQFVCISREQSIEVVQEYWDRQNLTLPFSPQKDRTIYELFANSQIPRIYISNPNLNVCFMSADSPLATEADLFSAIEEARK